MLDDGRCWDCGALIVWAETPAGGAVPLDWRPTPLGNLVVDQFGRTGPLKGGSGVPDYSKRYTRHRCPNDD